MALDPTPYQTNLLDRSQAIGGQAYTPFGQSTQVGANPMQTNAWESTYNRGMQGAPEVSAARDQMMNTINGGGFQQNPYLQQGNPYLQQSIDSTLGDMARNYNNTTKANTESSMAASGSFGNSGLAQIQGEQQRQLMQEQGRAASNMRFGDYQQQAQMYGDERNRQVQAMGLAPAFSQVDYTDLNAMQQAGNSLQGQQQAERTANYNQYLDSREWPFKTLGAQSSAMGVGGVGSANYQQTPVPNTGANILGGGLAGYQIGSGISDGSGGDYGGWGALAGGLAGLL